MERPNGMPRQVREPASPAPHWVRELSAGDRASLGSAGTGDLLPDGAVVLREDDIDRMGLHTLRRWLTMHSLRPRHPIALVRREAARPHRDEEELD